MEVMKAVSSSDLLLNLQFQMRKVDERVGEMEREREEGRDWWERTNMKWEKAHYTVTTWKVVIGERILRTFH